MKFKINTKGYNENSEESNMTVDKKTNKQLITDVIKRYSPITERQIFEILKVKYPFKFESKVDVSRRASELLKEHTIFKCGNIKENNKTVRQLKFMKVGY